MATLNGTQINNTYVGLLKTTDNLVLGLTTPSVITDGVGNITPLSIAQEKVILEQDNQRLEVNDTQTSIKGDTVLIQDATATNFVTTDLTTSNIGNATNYLTIDATDASFVGTVDFSTATVTGLPDDNTTYDLAATQDGLNVDITLTGSDATVDTVQLTAGTNITLTEAGGNITIDAAGGGGGGIMLMGIIANQNYGPEWSYNNPTGGAGLYGNIIIGFSAYLPAGTYDQFNHWVRTAATTVGATYDLAIYETSDAIPDNGAGSLKPTTLVPNAVVTGIDATVTGQKLITTASPFTVTGGWYFFAFRFDNGVDNNMEGSYAGIATGWVSRTFTSGFGFPVPYQFAQVNFGTDALLVGSTGEYTSMPVDLAGETTFGKTSYRLAFSVVAQ